jgi:cyanuric acid amidohydrolase
MPRDIVRPCRVFRLPAAHPADVSGVMNLIGSGAILVTDIRAIVGKTEANGCVNNLLLKFTYCF